MALFGCRKGLKSRFLLSFAGEFAVLNRIFVVDVFKGLFMEMTDIIHELFQWYLRSFLLLSIRNIWGDL